MFDFASDMEQEQVQAAELSTKNITVQTDSCLHHGCLVVGTREHPGEADSCTSGSTQMDVVSQSESSDAVCGQASTPDLFLSPHVRHSTEDSGIAASDLSRSCHLMGFSDVRELSHLKVSCFWMAFACIADIHNGPDVRCLWFTKFWPFQFPLNYLLAHMPYAYGNVLGRCIRVCMGAQ